MKVSSLKRAVNERHAMDVNGCDRCEWENWNWKTESSGLLCVCLLFSRSFSCTDNNAECGLRHVVSCDTHTASGIYGTYSTQISK